MLNTSSRTPHKYVVDWSHPKLKADAAPPPCLLRTGGGPNPNRPPWTLAPLGWQGTFLVKAQVLGPKG